MAKWITCGSVTDPKSSREFLRFSSKEDYATRESAEEMAKQWREENRYPFIWVERIGK